MVRAILWITGSWGCAFIFTLTALRAATSKSPVSFYPNMELKSDMFTNVRLYNKEICQLWFCYSFFFWMNGLAGVFDRTFSAIILLLCILPGIPLLIRRYNRILRTYLVPELCKPR